MVVTIASFKGGVAKTTTAIHLAAALARRGRTLLADGDLNQSALWWAARAPAPLPFTVEPRATADPAGYAHVVIDTPARPDQDDLRRMAQRSDVVLLPTTPDALALKAVLLTAEALAAVRASRVQVLLALVPPPPSRDAEDARGALTDSGLVVCRTEIPRLVAFQRAALEGVTVGELPGPRAARGWAAYRHLAKELLS